jgi:hypothetical protein
MRRPNDTTVDLDDDSHDHPRPFGKPKQKRSSFLGDMFDF